MSPFHTIQLSSGDFIVIHGNDNDPLHRVCLISSDGNIVKSFGGPAVSSSRQLYVPIHMAVDRNGFVFVVDFNNGRVLLLSPTLTYVREVVTRDQLRWWPVIVRLDYRRHLYVGVNKVKDGELVDGGVDVVNV